MQKTKNWAIGLVLLSTLLNTTAQTLYKFGANQLKFNITSIITNIPLIAGLAIYGISAIILIAALKGGELSVLYPIIATSYIWVTITSSYLLNEPINTFKWLGIFTIIIGVSLIGYGSTKNKHILKHVVTP